MSIEKVRNYFKSLGIEGKILEFDVSSATVELAAKALNCEPGKIAKTLSFSVDEKPVLIVCAGDAKIANSKFKACFKTKAKMLAHDDVERLVGHGVGGVCPFAVNDDVAIYLDESLKKYDFLYPACGSSNSAIKLTVGEIEKYSHAVGWVDVCKDTSEQ